MKSYEELVAELDSKIPRSEISSREGGNGVKLDYLSNYYVKSRLNEVLGQGNWSYRIVNRALTYSGPVKRYNGDVHSASYIVDVEFNAKIGNSVISFVDTGYGDGTDKTNPGKAHELAAKEAVTDALKRCVANLGQSMGLALYEKEQNYVQEESETIKPSVQSIKTDVINGDAPGNNVTAASSISNNRSSNRPNGKTSGNRVGSSDSLPVTKDIKAIKSSIKNAAYVLNAQGSINLDAFKAKYAIVGKVDDLAEVETIQIYNKVKSDYPNVFKGESNGKVQ